MGRRGQCDRKKRKVVHRNKSPDTECEGRWKYQGVGHGELEKSIDEFTLEGVTQGTRGHRPLVGVVRQTGTK